MDSAAAAVRKTETGGPVDRAALVGLIVDPGRAVAQAVSLNTGPAEARPLRFESKRPGPDTFESGSYFSCFLDRDNIEAT